MNSCNTKNPKESNAHLQISDLVHHVLNNALSELSKDPPTTFRPKTNVYKSEKAWYLDLAVPGYSKDQLSIEVKNDLLTIKASSTKQEGSAKVRLREFKIADFQRAFKLAKDIDTESIEAKLEGGILHFSLPIKEEALPKEPKKVIIV